MYKQEKQYEVALQCCYEGLDKIKLQIDGKYFRIREENKKSVRQTAKEFGVSKSTVHMVVTK